MKLKSLVLCSDEKIVRVLRRVLSDLDITMENCSDAAAAIRTLTRQRFEAVIVDCADERAASQVLKSARLAPCNKRAIAVAIIDGKTAVRSAFELGAHFVLYKPVSMERTKASFRAARALMKRERRRNTRIPVEMPVTLRIDGGGSQKQINTSSSDLGEGGIAIQLSRRPRNLSPLRVEFTLPGTQDAIACKGEIAWENAGRQAGIRFVDLSAKERNQLKAWVSSHAPEAEADDPPAHCKLTDLSLGGCYLEISSPFPAGTRVVLAMRAGQLQVRVDGVVRVMHPEIGMGVEFVRTTEQQREHVERFIQELMKSQTALPDLLVEADGLETESESRDGLLPPAEPVDDPLVALFRQKSDLPAEAFLTELRRQRGSTCEEAEPTFSI
ncbi:MAG TPA: PilZ domain-containing protein [Terriglobales bacterium]|nr:PilZ domain-containing protein [Terriglobales bacterium]